MSILPLNLNWQKKFKISQIINEKTQIKVGVKVTDYVDIPYNQAKITAAILSYDHWPIAWDARSL